MCVLESFSVSLSPHLEPSLHKRCWEFWRLQFGQAVSQAQWSGDWCSHPQPVYSFFPPHLCPTLGLHGVCSELPIPVWRPSVSAGVGAGPGFLGCRSPVPSLPAPPAPSLEGSSPWSWCRPCLLTSHFKPLSHLAQLLKEWNWEGMRAKEGGN